MIIKQLINLLSPLNRTKGNTKGLEEWLGIPVMLECSEGQPKGVIQFGIRKPIAPATYPLIICNPGSKRVYPNEALFSN